MKNKKNQIVLVFDVDNNFNSVADKYGQSGEKTEIAGEAEWLIRCAQIAIHQSYKEGAPRRIQMDKLTDNLREQLKKQLTKKQIEEINF